MRRARTVHADHCPSVRHRSGAGHSDVHHRLDSDRQSRLEADASLWLAIVRHLRILVKSDSNSMSNEIAYHTEARRFDYALHGRADIADMILSGCRLYPRG